MDTLTILGVIAGTVGALALVMLAMRGGSSQDPSEKPMTLADSIRKHVEQSKSK